MGYFLQECLNVAEQFSLMPFLAEVCLVKCLQIIHRDDNTTLAYAEAEPMRTYEHLLEVISMHRGLKTVQIFAINDDVHLSRLVPSVSLLFLPTFIPMSGCKSW